MSGKVKTNLLKYGITGAVALAMSVSYVLLRDDGRPGFWAWPMVDKCLVLCDAFTIPGIVLLGVWCLVWIGSQGGLDGVSFIVKYAARKLIPGNRGKQERYADYVQRKRANRAGGYGFLFVVGAIFLAAALVFMALFYGYYDV